MFQINKKAFPDTPSDFKKCWNYVVRKLLKLLNYWREHKNWSLPKLSILSLQGLKIPPQSNQNYSAETGRTELFYTGWRELLSWSLSWRPRSLGFQLCIPIFHIHLCTVGQFVFTGFCKKSQLTREQCSFISVSGDQFALLLWPHILWRSFL